MKIQNNQIGITLIALVITIIVLLILAGITITMTLGENGLLNRTQDTIQEYSKQEAIEKINFKVTTEKMYTYAKNQRMPTLQEIANALCEDDEIEYVNLNKKELASKEKVNIGNSKSIYTKLIKYPYEFEIDSSLQLSSIDGVKISTQEKEVIPEGYIKPSGTLEIKENKEYDVTNFAKVNVQVENSTKLKQDTFKFEANAVNNTVSMDYNCGFSPKIVFLNCLRVDGQKTVVYTLNSGEEWVAVFYDTATAQYIGELMSISNGIISLKNWDVLYKDCSIEIFAMQ